MANRKPLRYALEKSWRETIDGPYSKQQINSERGLQVHFCARLLVNIENDNWRILIEPKVKIDGRKNPIFPDILICSQRAVIAVVELKYTPRGKPSINNDLSKLRAFAAPETLIEVVNERFRGKRISPITYKLTKDALVCWAGVYTSKGIDFHFGENAKLNGKLLALHAITRVGANASVMVGSA